MEIRRFNIIRKIRLAARYPKLAGYEIKNRIRGLTGFDYHFLGGYSFPPLSVFLLPTGRCNLFCKMCDIGQSRINEELKKTSVFYKNISKDTEMAADEYGPFIRQIKSFNPRVSITGGEPLLYGDLEKLLYLISEKNRIVTTLVTNGLLLEKYAEMLVNSRLYELVISLDGLEDTVDGLRGVKGLFKKIIAGLDRVMELKAKKGSLLKVIINFTILPFNAADMGRFMEYISKYDIESVTFFHMLYKTDKMVEEYNSIYPALKDRYVFSSMFSGSMNPRDMDVKLLREQIENIKNKYSMYKINFTPDISGARLDEYYRNPELFISEKRCLMPWKSVQIAADGDVLLSSICCNKSMGNIKKDKFKDIWNNEEYYKFRRILKKSGAWPVCSRCCNII